MERAALFLDIDGTILSEITKEIPQSALDAMRAAKRAGHLLFINTGRTFCSIPPKISQFEFDGFLCGCGTYLTYHDEVLFSRSIPEKRGREIIDKMIECRLDGIMEGTQDIYLPSRMSRFDRLESSRRYFQNAGLGLEEYIEKGSFVYDKLFVYADELSDKDTFFKFVEKDIEPINCRLCINITGLHIKPFIIDKSIFRKVFLIIRFYLIFAETKVSLDLVTVFSRQMGIGKMLPVELF